GGPTDESNTAYEYYMNAGHADWLVFQGGLNSKGQHDCSIPPDIFDESGNWDTAKVNANLAWESYTTNDNIGRVPLDIGNPDVIAYQASFIRNAMQSGYDGLAV